MAQFEKNTRKTFRKAERLTSKKIINQLFTEGRSFHLPPLLVRYLPLPQGATHHQVLISVPGRHFKKASQRNRLKRQLREAYRQHKHLLADLPQKLAIAYIYSLKEKLPYKTIETKLIDSLHRLQEVTNHESEEH